MRNLAYLNKYFIKYKWRVLLGILFVSASNYFRILQPQVVRDALNLVVRTLKDYKAASPTLQPELYDQLIVQLTRFGGLVLFYALLMGLFMYFMRQTLIVMSRLIEYDMRKELFQHYLELDQGFYLKNRVGDLMARISDDITKVRMYLGPGIMYMINLTSLSILIIYSMIKVSPALTWYALFPLPILSISIYVISSIIQRKSTAIQKQLGILTSTAQETFSGIRVLKVFVKENDFKRSFNREANRLFDKNLSMTKVRALFFPLIIFLIGMSNLLTIYKGGQLLNTNKITAGNLAEFVIYINMLTWPFTAIGWIASIIQEASASQKRILEILSTKATIRSEGDIKSPISGDIRFENVYLRYEKEGKGVLSGIDLHIKPGQRVAIVGKTGSGKSTIAELLLRVIDPTEGVLSYDGINARMYDLHFLRSHIGYVPQDIFLFSDTVANNIGFATDDATMDEIIEAAKNANIHEEIINFPQGYDTLVGERGVSLSGGQKQRLAIARALIKRPTILLLDDALSAVDPTTRSAIYSSIQSNAQKQQGTTLITITHNFIHLDDLDNIYVLEGGKITQTGTAQQLLENQKGYFYKVYQHQREKDKNLEE